eukprot:6208281-Pleurochrysis_carterae.AAC.4
MQIDEACTWAQPHPAASRKQRPLRPPQTLSIAPTPDPWPSFSRSPRQATRVVGPGGARRCHLAHDARRVALRVRPLVANVLEHLTTTREVHGNLTS